MQQQYSRRGFFCFFDDIWGTEGRKSVFCAHSRIHCSGAVGVREAAAYLWQGKVYVLTVTANEKKIGYYESVKSLLSEREACRKGIETGRQGYCFFIIILRCFGFFSLTTLSPFLGRFI